MGDVRLHRWAETIAGYCTSVGPDDQVLIRCSVLAEPLLLPLFRACLDRGGHPTVIFSTPALQELLLRHGSERQLETLSPLEPVMAHEFDVILHVTGESNTRQFAGIDPSRQRIYSAARRDLRQAVMDRSFTARVRRCLTLYPTPAHAQEAGMSLVEYEEFLFDACFLNSPDPGDRWREVGAAQQRLIDRLSDCRTARIVARDTDLTLSLEGRTFINSDGKRNFPSGEIFTGPVENSANGSIAFPFPAIFNGNPVEGIRLRFAEGRVVEATATRGEAFLRAMLSVDEGASRLGEFAFGNNHRIRRFTGNILFDEKIGGTIHLALGMSYPETGGINRSGLHWDMICDLRAPEDGGLGDGGEIWIDGTLFQQNGRFIE